MEELVDWLMDTLNVNVHACIAVHYVKAVMKKNIHINIYKSFSGIIKK
jgi:hypothetical protein